MTVTKSQGQKISSFQALSLFALMCLNMQDGFDILAISYASNAIASDWQINRTDLGFVLSASLFGMMLGAIFLSPLADKIGRKPITILGLFLSGIGMLIACVAQWLEILILARALTGIGVGAILASLNTLVAEFAGERYRGQAVAILQLGFPLGAFLSGFIVAWLLDLGTWRYVFAFGAGTSFLFIPIMILLPESMDYLARSGRPDALERINKTRFKINMPPLESLEGLSARDRPRAFGAVKALFGPAYIVRTFLIWAAFFLVLTVLYFLLSWTPQILIDSGFTPAQGNQGGRLINLVGMGGIALVALASSRVRPSALTCFYLAVLGFLLIGLSVVSGLYIPSLWVIAGIGFVIHGSMIGLYATAPSLYPAEMRATGMGWAIGLSRFGAVLGPASAGILQDAGWSAADLFRLCAIPAFAGAGIVFFLWRDESQKAASL